MNVFYNETFFVNWKYTEIVDCLNWYVIKGDYKTEYYSLKGLEFDDCVIYPN